MSPRRDECVHQLNPHLVSTEVLLPVLTLRPKQLLVLVWNLVYHVAHLLVEVQHRLREEDTQALGNLHRVEGEFPWCVVYLFCSARSWWKWRLRWDQLGHPEGNKDHVLRTLISQSVVAWNAVWTCFMEACATQELQSGERATEAGCQRIWCVFYLLASSSGVVLGTRGLNRAISTMM